MNFELSEEQQLLKDSVERFVRESYSLDQRRALLESSLGYSEQHWRQMAELGWLGASVDERYGGSGGAATETMVLMQAFGAGLVLEPYFPSIVLGTNLIALAANEEQKKTLLPKVVAGELKLAFAYVEAQSGFDLFDVDLRATADGDSFLLNGDKGVVLGAPSAHCIIVSARCAGASREHHGIGLFLVARDAPGLAIRGYRTIDGLRAAELHFDNVRVEPASVLGSPDGAWPVIEAVAQRAVVALCAEALGIMDEVVRGTNEYLKTREQFGGPIGRFQVLQHQMADMLIASEESRSMMYVATARLADKDQRARARAVAGAKQLIGKNGCMIGECSVQLHGGMGMTDEMAIGHYFKRLSMIDIMFGDHTWQLKQYASL